MPSPHLLCELCLLLPYIPQALEMSSCPLGISPIGTSAKDQTISLGCHASPPNLCTSKSYPPFKAPDPESPTFSGKPFWISFPTAITSLFSPTPNATSLLYTWKVNQESQYHAWVMCPSLCSNRAHTSRSQNAYHSLCAGAAWLTIGLPRCPLASPAGL